MTLQEKLLRLGVPETTMATINHAIIDEGKVDYLLAKHGPIQIDRKQLMSRPSQTQYNAVLHELMRAEDGARSAYEIYLRWKEHPDHSSAYYNDMIAAARRVVDLRNEAETLWTLMRTPEASGVATRKTQLNEELPPQKALFKDLDGNTLMEIHKRLSGLRVKYPAYRDDELLVYWLAHIAGTGISYTDFTQKDI